jgi:hypothetical protein
MTPREAVVRVLHEAGEPLHWTAIQDRALRAGYIDPFTTPDVRGEVQRALHALRADGSIERVGTGVYSAR